MEAVVRQVLRRCWRPITSSEFKGRHRSPTQAKASKPAREKVETPSKDEIEPEDQQQSMLKFDAPTKDGPQHQASPQQPPTPPTGTPAGFRDLPLGDGRVFEFRRPSDWVMRDAIKTFYHLITLADDFDPTDQKVARLFSLVKVSE